MQAPHESNDATLPQTLLKFVEVVEQAKPGPDWTVFHNVSQIPDDRIRGLHKVCKLWAQTRCHVTLDTWG